jgi:two-component system, LytTR family, sensor kinase
MFNHSYRFLFVLLLSAYSYVRTLFIETYTAYEIKLSHLNIFFALVLLLTLLWEGNRLIEKYVAKKMFQNDESKTKQVLSLFLISNIWALLVVLITIEVNGVLVAHIDWGSMTNAQFKVVTMFSLCINLFLHCINTIVVYMNGYKQKQLEAEQLKTTNALAELQAIKNQINPHFLFNNLNVLSSLVMQKNNEANQFIEDFSGVYRYLLKNQDKQLVSVQTEIDFIKQYNFLLEKRFGYALNIKIDVPEKYRHYQIVPVALQMLVENAIKHNIVSNAKPLHIDIHVNGHETLVIKNNKQLKLNADTGTQIGLQNIAKRFEIITGRQIAIDETPTVFKVTLPIIQTQEEPAFA